MSKHRNRGLSTVHISAREAAENYNPQGWEEPAEVEYYEGSGVATVRRRRVRGVDCEQTHRPRRGTIKEFSYKSRLRLMRVLARVRRSALLPLFITLTYPNLFPEDPQVWKRDLDNWVARLQRMFPGAGLVWRLEIVPRKSGSNKGKLAPHFHLLVWGVELTPWFKYWLSRTWYQVVGSGDPRHLKAGTRVELIRSQRHMIGYLSKVLGRVMMGEMAKETQAIAARIGRWWGVRFAGNIPFGVRKVVQISERAAIDAIRYMRRFAGIRSRAYRSLTCFLDADQWAEKLRWATAPRYGTVGGLRQFAGGEAIV